MLRYRRGALPRAVNFISGSTIAAGWARKITRKGLERGGVDPTLVPFVAKLVYYGLLAVVVIAALNRVGVATTSVVAIFGAARPSRAARVNARAIRPLTTPPLRALRAGLRGRPWP